MNETKDVEKELQERRSRVRQVAQRLGLSAIIGVAGGSAMAGNADVPNTSKPTNNIQNEIRINDNTENSIDVAVYLKTYALDRDSDLNIQKKLGNGMKAYYSRYLDEGRGGIVVTQYSMSDTEVFAYAKKQMKQNLILVMRQ